MPRPYEPIIAAMVTAAARHGIPQDRAECVALAAVTRFRRVLGTLQDDEAAEAMIQAAFRPRIRVQAVDFTIMRG